MRFLRVAVNAEQLLYRSPGGIGRYTAQLLTLLPALPAGCEVAPFTARHSRSEVEAVLARWGVGAEVVRGAAVQPLPRPALYEGWVRAGWPPLRGLGPVGVVHAPSVAVPPRGRAPLVVTVHDAAPELFPEAFPRRGLAFHRRGIAAAAARADAVIAVSQAAADEIAAHTPIPADRITVVANGVAPPEADPGRDRAVIAARRLEGRRYVLWVGSLEPRKGVGTLVAAMAGLHRRGAHRDVMTVLAGYAGWLNDDLVRPEDRAALGDSLVQAGRVGEDELWALYRNATVFALPSRHEGFGLPVVEAMSQGTPVIASDIAAVREVAGEAAVLVDPRRVGEWQSALDGLLDDPARREELAREGRARSRLYTAEAMAAGTFSVYQQIGS
jgi:glycosyltransferase involved in cell wall biosynthesis